MTTWDTAWLGLDYTSWNRVMLIPLVLMALGAVLFARRAVPRGVAISWRVVAVGFALSATGVVVEFVIGRGLQGGTVGLANAGWILYLLGQAVAALGAAVLTVALVRWNGGRLPALAAGLTALTMLIWPALLAGGQEALAVLDQLLVGAAWALLAAVMVRSSPAGARAGQVPEDVAAAR